MKQLTSRSTKVFVASILLTFTGAASAVQVVLLSHEQTAGDGSVVSTLITDGSHVSGIAPPSTAIWDWDGTTLSSTGLYSALGSLGGSQFSLTVTLDQVVDLSINTNIATATATSYACVEGTFLANIGVNGCGGYNLGANFIDESTTVWSGTNVNQMLGGDDFGTVGPRRISAYDFFVEGFVGVDGLTNGDIIVIGNGAPPTNPASARMTFQVQTVPVPPAVWLFGSALGMLRWLRRNTRPNSLTAST